MADSGGSASAPSLPPPRPKSPPHYPDLYGKRRQLAKIQLLEREIGFLEDELKSVGGLQPASRCCKDVADFMVANSDPLIQTSQKIHSSCHFWKWLCGLSCFNLSWVCCYGCPCPEMPGCNFRRRCCSRLLGCCSMPKCKLCCCSWPKCQCFDTSSCCSSSSSCCRNIQCPASCPDCSCSGCTCCRPTCPKVSSICSSCTKNSCCCSPCYLCY